MTPRRIAFALSLPLVAVALAAAIVVGPYVRDDLVLDHVVRSVALDWRDFGREAATERLQYELDRQHIGMQVGDDDCALEEGDAGRSVRCAWTVELAIPGGRRLPLAFESRATVGSDGSLL